MAKINKVSIYVLNYNGEKLLPECLPSIREAVSKSKHQVTLYVIDNRSTDSSLQVLANQFPQISVLVSPENLLLCSFNQYVEKDSADVVILMNNDVKVDKLFIDPLIEIFERNKDAFLASSLCHDFTGTEYEGGISILEKKLGIWGTSSPEPPKEIKTCYTASIGICMVFRRDRFNELNGFDHIYLPGTLEDLDICYRGWKKGWKAYFTRDSVIYHKRQASFKAKFGTTRIRQMACRNTFLFIWKNISDPVYLFEHFACLLPRLLFSVLTLDAPFLKGMFKAFGKFPTVLQKRLKNKVTYSVSDREILKIFKDVSTQLKGK